MSEQQPTSRNLRLSPVHVHAVGVAGLLLLSGVAYAFGIAPSLDARVQAQQQREAIARTGDRARLAQEQLEAAQADLALLRSDMDHVPIESEQLVGSITDAASSFGLSPIGVDRSGQQPAGDFLRTTLTLHAGGSYSDIQAFVTGLRDHLPTATIDGFAITAAPIESQGLMLIVTVLVYAPQAATPDAGAPQAVDSSPAAGDSTR
ncbi:MAG: GspMb/PilO family protein [Phycisphaerales bacterium JB060]